MESAVADSVSTETSPKEIYNSASGTLQLLLTLIVLGALILATVVGNAFVIAAVILERNLRTHFANYLVASLAVADMLVAVLVMPVAAIKDVTSRWIFGQVVCDAWISIDVICCTASILHLVAISVDRYWAVTRLDYIHNRSKQSILLMIAISWTISIVISLPPLFLNNNPDQNASGQACIISQNIGYTIFSTVSAFYLPFIIMMIIYLKVYQVARNRIRRKRFKVVPNRASHHVDVEQTVVAVQVIRTSDDVADIGDGKNLPLQCHGDETLRKSVGGADPRRSVDQSGREPGTDCHVTSVVDQNKIDDEVAPSQPLAEIGSTGTSRDAAMPSCCVTMRRDSCVSARRDECRRVSLIVDVKQHVDLLTVVNDCPDVGPHSNATTERRRELISDCKLQCPDGSRDTGGPIARHASVDTLSRGRLTVGCDVIGGRRHSMNQLSLPHSSDTQALDSRVDFLKTRTASRRSRSFLDVTRQLMMSSSSSRAPDDPVGSQLPRVRSREQTELRRERKAARTLAIITGTFILCWLPFFILAILRPFCGDRCGYPDVVVSIIGWLGYVNSLLNPVIYTVFNPDFRSAFSRILFGKYNLKSRRR